MSERFRAADPEMFRDRTDEYDARVDATRQQPPPQKGLGAEIATLVKSDAQVFINTLHIDSAQGAYQALFMIAKYLYGDYDYRQKIANDIEARAVMGKKKYGERLHAHNGRDARLDLRQEILDALMYCRQVIEEER
jgi:hypothetical protein